ncbi:MAG TPA: hypothetical protein VGG29_19720 [Caulobacteraceae bacterium]|jgi:hypothetical protein
MKPTGRSPSHQALRKQACQAQPRPSLKARAAALEAVTTIAWAMAPLVVTAVVAFA